ncbi:ABC transporter ATP-binding protein [Bombilactobacillus bombi]|uniref:ABC transporter ATP-binding protein n=1 Tax=Bombilactobacillus bombi TaxID=1303590 RepID=A0A347SQB3_9LACO|nr:ABC transporter ATP-binding protein [Bombilactobacillus bombi]AXX64222.1 ABC transporter ATP-binding protein [Bombilactobacillus bombi]MCO6541426.1 ABC transporter ATP-binding protein [Lactobacillus sp.]RHW51774.1 ABC transporter ATP-binding protein [Bombilactobacillus bombi]
MALLFLQDIKKSFHQSQDGPQVEVLKSISLSVDKGEYVAIMGESGSGKTTLLNIIATLDQATTGTIKINKQDLNELSENKRAIFRRKHLGFVFQNFNLLNTFNNQDNILLPLVLDKVPYKRMENKLLPLAKSLNISDLLQRYPYEISGGQRQRVAAARALITNPELILADEPTGALDSYNSELLLDLFEQINRQGQTILMVTHSAAAASHSQRTLFIKDGRIFHEVIQGQQSKKQYLQQITESATMLLNVGGTVQ